MHSAAWLRMRSVRRGRVFVLNFRGLHWIAMATREYPSSLTISILLSHCLGWHVAGAVSFFSRGFSSVYGAIIIAVCIVSTLSILCLRCLYCVYAVYIVSMLSVLCLLSDYNCILLLFSQCLLRLREWFDLLRFSDLDRWIFHLSILGFPWILPSGSVRRVRSRKNSLIRMLMMLR
jgi:hypothetical protein